MRKLVLISILIVAFASPATAEEFSVGGWHGVSFSDPGTGEFKFCSISARFGETGLTLGITVDKAILVVVDSQKWNFQQGTSLNFTLKADDRILGPSRTDVTGPSEIRVALQYTDESFNQIASSATLTLSDGAGYQGFDISTSGEALGELHQCYLTGYVITRAKRQQEAEMLAILSIGPTGDRILAGSGLDQKGFKILTAKEGNGWYGDAKARWSDGIVIGALYEFPKQGQGFDAIAAAVLGSVEADCKGEYDTFDYDVTPLPNGASHRFVAQHCLADIDGFSSWVALFDDGKQVVVVFHGVPKGNVTAIDGPSADVYNYLRRVLGSQ